VCVELFGVDLGIECVVCVVRWVCVCVFVCVCERVGLFGVDLGEWVCSVCWLVSVCVCVCQQCVFVGINWLLF
jgi:hypothetical protein